MRIKAKYGKNGFIIDSQYLLRFGGPALPGGFDGEAAKTWVPRQSLGTRGN